MRARSCFWCWCSAAGQRRLSGNQLIVDLAHGATGSRAANDSEVRMAEQNTDDPPLEQVEFDINDINSEVAQNAVRDAVKDLNGVRDVQFVGGGAIVTYNPIGTTREEICTAIRRSGYRATEITSAPPN